MIENFILVIIAIISVLIFIKTEKQNNYITYLSGLLFLEIDIYVMVGFLDTYIVNYLRILLCVLSFVIYTIEYFVERHIKKKEG